MLEILLIFAIVMIAIRLNFSLGNGFLIGTVCMGLVFGMPFSGILQSVLGTLVQANTIALCTIVSLILILSHSMEEIGQMTRLMDRYQGLVNHHLLNLIVFPALIGLLPMPGGTVFSAPMVKNLGRRLDLSGARLSYINYWFRHIWEYCWPLFPGVLLATTLSGIDIWTFAALLSPLTVAALGFGCWPLRNLKNAGPEISPPVASNDGRMKAFLYELQPILLVIGMGLGLQATLNFLPQRLASGIPGESGMIISLLLAIGWVWHRNRMTGSQWRGLVFRREMAAMIYMIVGILMFKGVLQDSGAAQVVSRELIQLKIPLFLIVIVLPMLVGAVCGITVAFVGTTFPVLVSLIVSSGQGGLMPAYVMLAMVSGFTGVLFSPLHLCLVLSNQYFGITPAGVHRYLIYPCMGVMISACIYFAILQAVN